MWAVMYKCVMGIDFGTVPTVRYLNILIVFIFLCLNSELFWYSSSDRNRYRRRDNSVDNYRDRSRSPDHRVHSHSRRYDSSNRRYRDTSNHSSYRHKRQDRRRRSYRHRRRSTYTSESSRVSSCSRDTSHWFWPVQI